MGENAASEANFDDIRTISQSQAFIQVTANSGDLSGLDKELSEPIEAAKAFTVIRFLPNLSRLRYKPSVSAESGTSTALPLSIETTAMETECPGCKLRMPVRSTAHYEGGFNASAECWGVFSEVIEKEFSNPVLFGQVHQLTVDAYAAQHAGGNHRDKSVVVHLCGLYLVLERGMQPTDIPKRFQHMASTVRAWPHLLPTREISEVTVFDVALADSQEMHATLVRRWASFVWQAWQPHHETIRAFVAEHLGYE